MEGIMNPTDAFGGLIPEGLWQHFAALTHIPRPSGREEHVADYIRSWAAAQRFKVLGDAAGNLCVWVPGSPGRENAAPVILQSHLDMVCERNADSAHDAEEGRIHVTRDGDWIQADDTTLGADNGIGVAAMLHAAGVGNAPHGPLDLLFTVDEETGLTGARNLDPAILRGRRMINLDSEDDGVLFVGCAGGCDSRTTLNVAPVAIPGGWVVQTILISGAQGGHSGMDIDKNRLNAIVALVRILQEVRKTVPLMLAAVDGGNKSNAIPRECRARIFYPSDQEVAFREAAKRTQVLLEDEYRRLDDGFCCDLRSVPDRTVEALTQLGTEKLLDLLSAIPSGVIAMSQDIPGLVETSTNLGVIRTAQGTVEIVSCSRSSQSAALHGLMDRLGAIARLAGARFEELPAYPGWRPNLDSVALATTRSAYRKLYGDDPKITAVHAGLECGLIGEKVPGMDMVSFGPQIRGVHAPGERVSIKSVTRFWSLLTTTLDDLSLKT
jgi:dipeptidase D